MRQIICLTCAMLALNLMSGCSRSVSVKIGVAAPMSGSLAQYGKDLAQGAQIAVDELNADHFLIDGKQAHFELVVEDDKASPENGKAVAKRLIDGGVAAVFGHFNSDVSIAAAPLYANAGIPQLSAVTNPRYTRMGLKTTFRISADDIDQGATLGRLIGEKLKPKSIFVVDDHSTFGTGLASEVINKLKSTHGAPPHESIDAKSADFAALAERIKASNADLVFYGGDEVAGVPLLKALHKAGSSARFVAGDGMCDAFTIKSAQGAADRNFYCSMPGVPPSWLSSGIGFMQLYRAKFGEPGSYSPVAYDGIHVLAQAMQRANSADPKTYLPEMRNGSFDGKIQGVVEFDSKGDIKDGTVVIYQSIGGQLMEQRNLL